MDVSKITKALTKDRLPPIEHWTRALGINRGNCYCCGRKFVGTVADDRHEALRAPADFANCVECRELFMKEKCNG